MDEHKRLHNNLGIEKSYVVHKVRNMVNKNETVGQFTQAAVGL